MGVVRRLRGGSDNLASLVIQQIIITGPAMLRYLFLI